MKVVEQYLKAVGSKLPWRKRKDITDELRAVLLDQIEERYGTGPTERELKEFLTGYGSPGSVAAGYRDDRPIIATGLTDLYKLVLLAVAGAMLVAFTVVGIIDIIEHRPVEGQLFLRIITIPAQALQGWISGMGMVTIIFIIMSRFMKQPEVDLDEDWKVEDLKDMPVDENTESRLESFITVGFLSLFIVLLNVYPGIITLLENMFARTGLGPHHILVVERFRIYVIFLSVLWAAGIILRVAVLRRGEKTRAAGLVEAGLSAAEALLDGVMLADAALFMAVGDGGWIGFKVILAVGLVANIGETLGAAWRLVRRKVSGE